MLLRCANPVSPIGGPKDEAPPVLLKAFPPQKTTNFNSTKIKLTFNEFVEFKDLTKQLIISPPMIENPDIKIKQKSIEIQFKEELKPNTTYNLFFGNAIVDITEGNPYTNFQYVFSTGNFLDSLTFKGSVSDALNLEPVEGISVMLYLNNNDTLPFDSLPYFVRPYFMSRTDKDGLFTFFNLPNKDFKIFALEDGNSNLLFDQVSERIAFSDDLIHPYFIPLAKIPDSLTVSDSLTISDSLNFSDSLDVEKEQSLFKEPDPLALLLFQQVDSVQRIIKGTLSQKNNVIFVFKRPVISPKFTILNMDLEPDWKIQEINANRDTISWWLKNIPADSLDIIVSDNNEILDTLQLALVKYSRRKEKTEEVEKPEPLKVIFDKSLVFEQPLNLRFNYPIVKFNPESILLVEGEDSLSAGFVFNDSLPRQARIEHVWKEKTSYSIQFRDSIFTDLLGRSNDSIKQSFITKPITDFGNVLIHLKINDSNGNYIFQLLKEDKVMKEIYLSSSQDLRINYLKAGAYHMRFIYDSNNNGKWDPGHYIGAIFPEKVVYFQTEITIRSNWDLEEEWEL